MLHRILPTKSGPVSEIVHTSYLIAIQPKHPSNADGLPPEVYPWSQLQYFGDAHTPMHYSTLALCKKVIRPFPSLPGNTGAFETKHGIIGLMVWSLTTSDHVLN